MWNDVQLNRPHQSSHWHWPKRTLWISCINRTLAYLLQRGILTPPKLSSCQQHASKPCDCKRFPSSSKALQGATFPLECLLVGSIEVRMVIAFFRQVKMTKWKLIKNYQKNVWYHSPPRIPHSSLVQIKVALVARSNPNRLPEDLLKWPQWKGLDAGEWASYQQRPPLHKGRVGRHATSTACHSNIYVLRFQVCLQISLNLQPIPLHWVFHSSNGRTAGGSQGIISQQERWRTMPTIL